MQSADGRGACLSGSSFNHGNVREGGDFDVVVGNNFGPVFSREGRLRVIVLKIYMLTQPGESQNLGRRWLLLATEKTQHMSLLTHTHTKSASSSCYIVPVTFLPHSLFPYPKCRAAPSKVTN